MRIVDGFEKETEGALKLLDHCLGQDSELDVWVFIVQVFAKLGDTLRIGFSLEFETLPLKQRFQFFVVGNNTVVYDCKLPVRIRSGMLMLGQTTHHLI